MSNYIYISLLHVFIYIIIMFTCPTFNDSGALNAGVPAVEPLVIVAFSPMNSLQTPKSAILTRPHSVNNKFPGLISA